MFLLIVSILSILFIYIDYYRKKNIGRTILLVIVFIIALYLLFRVMRIFRYGLLFALILLPIYYSIIRRKKSRSKNNGKIY
ncbi:MAG: hypothetical protein HWE22_12950 [Flavobacteriales bacterium]|nr:hypothetical protein [Flavobacteriales bacterium]